MSAVHTLDATPLGVAAVRATVAAAFTTDPMLQWIFPEPVCRAQATAAWLGVFVEAYAAAGVVDVVDESAAGTATGSMAGAALWRIGQVSLPFSTLPSAGGLLGAFVGVERAAQLALALRAFADNKPSPPFHYLQFLAVHPDHQRQGLGRVLVQHGQQRAASAGVGVYLESTNAGNLPFYRSLGFEPIGEFALQPDGPTSFRLWWQP